MDPLPAIWQTASPSAQALGTRFLIYPQAPFIPGYERPELVWISTPPGQVEAGPADRRMYVVDPLLAKAPYHRPYLPPWRGDIHTPAEPGPDGHFDHLPPESRQFMGAHAFACVRRILDIAESYLGREIPWFFRPTYDRLEIVPHLPWTNAQSGYGFLELGEDDTWDEPFPYALNFDVVAHETAHLILFGIVGVPERRGPGPEFLAHHECVADFMSLICLLHFDSALDRILRRTKGNLLIVNELDRLAELADERQIRTASHSLKMTDVGRDAHDLSKPLTGALFDTLVEVYHLLLVERGLADLDTRRIRTVREDLTQQDIDRQLTAGRETYEVRHFAMKSALEEARDIVGEALMHSWLNLDPDTLTLRDAADAVLAEVDNGRGRRFADRLHDNLAWRGIL